jgi:carbon-monoxide dehydrogenase medium subunit
MMWKEIFRPNNLEDALQRLAETARESGEQALSSSRARIIAGGTDLILELERGVRTGVEILIDVTHIPDLDLITLDEDGMVHLGPLVTHNDCVASKLIVEKAFPLAQAAWEVGAPQIRNRGTVAGNLITASPANDTITPLMALNAQVRLAAFRGTRVVTRTVALSDFYLGVRRTVLQPDEMLVDITFPALTSDQRGSFMKVGLRRAQAIAVVNAAVILSFLPADESSRAEKVQEARISLGAVAPRILRAEKAEEFLVGRSLEDEVIRQAAELANQAAHPIDDLRGSADYRREMVKVSVSRLLKILKDGKEKENFPENPVLLQRKIPTVDFLGSESTGSTQTTLVQREGNAAEYSRAAEYRQPIQTVINGKAYTFKTGHGKTLLRLLREEAGLIGTKEGCAEGECGACTIFLNGEAVMSCLVPAESAHGAEIQTIEGLTHEGGAEYSELHPVQQAFVELGAVQCGYCTPGLIMSAVKLLEEKQHPTKDEIQQAITGNLCRCTGYYSIVQAIELAAQRMSEFQAENLDHSSS